MLSGIIRSSRPATLTAFSHRINPNFGHAPSLRARMSSNTTELQASKLFDLSFLTAVVTGGGTGIGLMISQALVANGAKVYITGRRKEVLEQTIQSHGAGAGSLHALPGDINSKEGCVQLARDIAAKEPKGFQLLVNNAGIARDDNTKFCVSQGIRTYEWTADVNL